MIYFIQSMCSGKYIKIGRTINIEDRLAELQTGNAYKLILLGITNGGKRKEVKLHKQFEAFRFKGEWFKPVEEILNFISDQKIKPSTVLFVTGVTERLFTISPIRPAVVDRVKPLLANPPLPQRPKETVREKKVFIIEAPPTVRRF